MASTNSPTMPKNDEKTSRLGQQSAAERIKDVASALGEKAEDATTAVGAGLKSLGHSIRDHTPNSGMVGDASSAVTNTLERTGRYLQEQGLEGIAENVSNLIRRNPIPAMLVGIGAGFLIARATAFRS